MIYLIPPFLKKAPDLSLVDTHSERLSVVLQAKGARVKVLRGVHTYASRLLPAYTVQHVRNNRNCCLFPSHLNTTFFFTSILLVALL